MVPVSSQDEGIRLIDEEIAKVIQIIKLNN